MTSSIIILILCLVLSMFFSGTETAVTAASEPLLYEKEKKGDKKATLLLELKQKPDRFLSMILFGNNVVNIAATAVTTSLCIRLFGDHWGIFVSTFIVSFIVLIFCEIFPKTVAIRHPNSLSLFFAPILWGLTFVLSPLLIFLNTVVKSVMRILGLLGKEESLSDEKTEIRGVINMHKDSSLRSESNMLNSVLDLSEVSVQDIMTYRNKITSFDADLPIKELIDKIINCPYTRVPLWQNKPSNIVGVLHTKLLLRALHTYQGDIDNFNVMSATTQPWFVLETTSLLDQLQSFRRRREHFAIVVDEYGVIQGIVTLEDLLEEIVGDIMDETDHPQESQMRYTSQPDGSVIVDGGTSIRDLNRTFGWELPDDEASTIAGLLMYKSERIPQQGNTYLFFGFGFKVLETNKNRIVRICITPAPNDLD